ncbi:MAG: hypothetical protein Q9166_001478 [cf. Caloplaca sp. 2 TL-2023]
MLSSVGSFMGLTGEAINVFVGTSKKPFIVHRDLLIAKSTFFNAALTGTWKEATEGKIRLTEEDPAIFSTYVLWIYNQNWTCDGDGKELTFDACCRLYILADKFGSEALQNLAIDKLRHRVMGKHTGLHLPTIAFAYEATLPGSPLRKLLADYIVLKADSTKCKSLIDVAPECLFDAFKICKDRIPLSSRGVAPYDDQFACGNYHVHRDGNICPSPPPQFDADQVKSKRSRKAKDRQLWVRYFIGQ